MQSSQSPSLSCSNCGSPVREGDRFCHQCGGLFDQKARCVRHADEEAEGVCVVCQQSLCGECGRWVDDVFLCADHEEEREDENLA